MRDAKVLQIDEGTSQSQRLIVAKEIFERARGPPEGCLTSAR